MTELLVIDRNSTFFILISNLRYEVEAPTFGEYQSARKPVSFHARINFQTVSLSIGPTPRNVFECSSVCFVSSRSPPHDMRVKFSSKKSINLAAGLAASCFPEVIRFLTLPTQFSNGMIFINGMSSASARIGNISLHCCRTGLSI